MHALDMQYMDPDGFWDEGTVMESSSFAVPVKPDPSKLAGAK